MLTHILVVSRGEKPREPLEALLDEFVEEVASCEGVLRIHWAENLNPTGAALGYDYVCVSELPDLETMRTEYWDHPAHRALLAELPQLCEARFALDIESSEGEGE